MKTILFATDQPFWRRENGAQQRTWSIVQVLLGHGFELRFFFLVAMTPADVVICREHGLQIELFDPRSVRTRDRIAVGVSGLLQKIRECFRHDSRDTSDEFLTLESYRWPLASMQFRSLVESMCPDYVFSVYIVWAHLLDAFPERQRCFRALVDTHDLLHLRQQEFSQRQQGHWIEISRDEEAAALCKFDLILATQVDEAAAIRDMVPDRDVVVVGHCPGAEAIGNPSVVVDTGRDRDRIRFGFIASENAANVDGIRWFLEECWGDVHRASGAELVIAGTVGDAIARGKSDDWAGVRCVGRLDRIEDFYNEIDVAINPVRFGSGIKIKSIEALYYGKPLIAHSHNTRGLPQRVIDATLVEDDSTRFAKACLRLSGDEDLRREISERCDRVRQMELSLESVYRDLLEWLRVDCDGSP
ncbi:glycosyltransferase family 4 protein [Rhodopirellula sp. SWK7]|uniref:glycosyltransferase family 4 protein n=1 Tax=Rhodopirellula sp. SWK7 TaxID=595460 RepID=UPI0002BFFC08|nr:glycosyltransferase family 4 protein [Rhodopirellula sp. SWK7]EMI45577.1 glycosyl transferase, group 1 [Rhodopirellula sp. SWK7]